MAKTPFSFTDSKKNVLKQKADEATAPKTSKKMGRPKAKISRTNKVICYFSDDEYQAVMEFLNGRPASSGLRDLIMNNINKT